MECHHHIRNHNQCTEHNQTQPLQVFQHQMQDYKHHHENLIVVRVSMKQSTSPLPSFKTTTTTACPIATTNDGNTEV